MALVYLKSKMPAFKARLNDKKLTVFELFVCLGWMGVDHALDGGLETDMYQESELNKILVSDSKIRELLANIKKYRSDVEESKKYAEKLKNPKRSVKDPSLTKTEKTENARQAYFADLAARRDAMAREKQKEDEYYRHYNPDEDMQYQSDHLGIDDVDESLNFIRRVR